MLDLFELTGVAFPEWTVARPTVATPDEATTPTVLVAEDSDFFRTQISNFLRGAGYDVIACEDGQAAWECLQRGDVAVQVVVTDVEMPRLNGLELTRRIKGDPALAHLPVVAVTSLAGDDDQKKGLAAGVNEYMVKLDRERLVEAVDGYLRQATRNARKSTPVQSL
jgi:two-component system, chemotaxis family, sensor kinase CheA